MHTSSALFNHHTIERSGNINKNHFPVSAETWNTILFANVCESGKKGKCRGELLCRPGAKLFRHRIVAWGAAYRDKTAMQATKQDGQPLHSSIVGKNPGQTAPGDLNLTLDCSSRRISQQPRRA